MKKLVLILLLFNCSIKPVTFINKNENSWGPIMFEATYKPSNSKLPDYLKTYQVDDGKEITIKVIIYLYNNKYKLHRLKINNLFCDDLFNLNSQAYFEVSTDGGTLFGGTHGNMRFKKIYDDSSNCIIL